MHSLNLHSWNDLQGQRMSTNVREAASDNLNPLGTHLKRRDHAADHSARHKCGRHGRLRATLPATAIL